MLQFISQLVWFQEKLTCVTVSQVLGMKLDFDAYLFLRQVKTEKKSFHFPRLRVGTR